MEIHRRFKTQEEADEFRELLEGHNSLQRREREEMQFRIEYSQTQPNCLMLLTDSPSKLSLPNLPNDRNTKEVAQKAMAFRLTGYVNTNWSNSAKAITLLMEPASWYSHTGNYAISLLDQQLRMELNGKPIPDLFINQTDRGPEYNNLQYLQFLGLLLLTGVVNSAVLYGRLPVGHR